MQGNVEGGCTVSLMKGVEQFFRTKESLLKALFDLDCAWMIALSSRTLPKCGGWLQTMWPNPTFCLLLLALENVRQLRKHVKKQTSVIARMVGQSQYAWTCRQKKTSVLMALEELWKGCAAKMRPYFEEALKFESETRPR